MTSRERATAFILSLPKLEGFQLPSEKEPEKFRVYRQLIDRLEKEMRSAKKDAIFTYTQLSAMVNTQSETTL